MVLFDQKDTKVVTGNVTVGYVPGCTGTHAGQSMVTMSVDVQGIFAKSETKISLQDQHN